MQISFCRVMYTTVLLQLEFETFNLDKFYFVILPQVFLNETSTSYLLENVPDRKEMCIPQCIHDAI